MIRILLILTVILIAWLGMAQPVNDAPANAIEVPVNNYCSSNGEFTTMGATADGTVPSTSITSPIMKDILNDRHGFKKEGSRR